MSGAWVEARTGRTSARVSELALCACLSLAGCGGDAGVDPATAFPNGGAVVVPDEAPGDDAASAGSNFTFSVGEAYRSRPTTSAESVARLEAFFEGALEPLQRLPGLLPRTVSVVYDRCGEANAFHDGAAAVITLCDELAQYALSLFTESEDPSGQGEGGADPVASFVLPAMGFVLYHEIAHAFDFQRDLPIAGNLESNMDSIATVIAIETGRPLYALAGAAVFGNEPPSLAGVHGGGLDRGGDIVCWAGGGEPAVRTVYLDPDIVAIFGVGDVFTAEGRDCESEYAGLRRTVRTWLPGLARLGGTPFAGGDPSPGDAPAFRLRFGQRWLEGTGTDPAARARVETVLVDAFGPLEAAVAGLPGPIEVVYDACGAPRSSYDPAARTLTLCAELVEFAYAFQDDGPDATPTALAYSLQIAHEWLAYALYHEVGHALASLGRLPDDEPVELASDAVAMVLLVETGNGLAALYDAVILSEQPAAQSALHGEVGARAFRALCLVIGGDASVRARLPADTLALYTEGSRDCVAEYPARRDAVRAWLAGTQGRRVNAPPSVRQADRLRDARPGPHDR